MGEVYTRRTKVLSACSVPRRPALPAHCMGLAEQARSKASLR